MNLQKVIRKKLGKQIIFGFFKVTDEKSRIRIRVIPWYGSADPDLTKNHGSVILVRH
jgi:hypothetical protein